MGGGSGTKGLTPDGRRKAEKLTQVPYVAVNYIPHLAAQQGTERTLRHDCVLGRHVGIE